MSGLGGEVYQRREGGGGQRLWGYTIHRLARVTEVVEGKTRIGGAHQGCIRNEDGSEAAEVSRD